MYILPCSLEEQLVTGQLANTNWGREKNKGSISIIPLMYKMKIYFHATFTFICTSYSFFQFLHLSFCLSIYLSNFIYLHINNDRSYLFAVTCIYVILSIHVYLSIHPSLHLTLIPGPATCRDATGTVQKSRKLSLDRGLVQSPQRGPGAAPWWGFKGANWN